MVQMDSIRTIEQGYEDIKKSFHYMAARLYSETCITDVENGV